MICNYKDRADNVEKMSGVYVIFVTDEILFYQQKASTMHS